MYLSFKTNLFNCEADPLKKRLPRLQEICRESFLFKNYNGYLVRYIKAGEEISDCYGQMYYVKTLEQR